MNGQRKALIVASDDYEHEGLQRLLAPEADAEALAGVLGDPQIGEFDVQVVRNETAHIIQEQIEDFFSEARPDDVLLLHFSCHGLKSDSGELFFAARNTRPHRLGSTAVPADFVQRCMRASRSRCIVLFLDCCYGGAFGQGVTVRTAGDVNVMDSFPSQKLGGGRGRAVITASSSMEYAFEGDHLADDRSQQPSVFTTALVEGLATGEADRDEDGWVALNELYDYVFDKVRERNPYQTPSRDVEMQGDVYLARSRRRRIRAMPIPPDLHAAMTDPNMFTRLGAVGELRARLRSDNLPAAAGAVDALAEMARNDIGAVAEPAAAALREVQVQTGEPELNFGQVATGSALEHQLIHLLGPPLVRVCAFEVSHRWIQIKEAAEGFDVSVDTSEAGGLRGAITLKGPVDELIIPVNVEVRPVSQLQHQEAEEQAQRDTDEPHRPEKQTPSPDSAGSQGAGPAQRLQRTAIDFATWLLRPVQAWREAQRQKATETRARGYIGLPASWGLVLIGVILFVDGFLLVTIPSLLPLRILLFGAGSILLVAGAVAVAKTIRRRRWEAKGPNAAETQAGGHIGLSDSWGLGRLTRHQLAIAASVGLGIISLVVVLGAVIARSVDTGPVTIAVGTNPLWLAVTPDGRHAYVTNYDSNDVSVIDTESNTVTATISVGNGTGPWEVAVTPNGRHAYVTNYGSDNVSMIDTDSNTVTAAIAVGGQPQAVAVAPDGGHAYVTNSVSNNVSVIDTASNTVTATIPVGAGPGGVAVVAPDGRHAYVTNYGSDNVSVIDTASNTVTATIPVGTSPWGVAVTPDGHHAYVTNYGSNSVSVIDTESNTVTATIPVGLGTAPEAVAVAPDGGHAYVTNSVSNNVSVIDTASNTVTGTIPVGTGPNGVAVTPDGRHAYVTNNGSNNVSVIEINTGGTVPVGLQRFYRQDLAWGGCSAFATTPSDERVYADPGLQCAYLEVPLDYADSNGRTVQVGLLRRPASDPAQRIGSLIVNPGGPGVSGMSRAASLVNQVTNNDLGRRFDLVGFDPRGIGSSKPRVLCRTPEEWDTERLMNLHVNTSPDGVAQTESQEKATNAGCVSRTGTDVLANIGTRNVARDMDIMRSALGDEKLTYLGFSYGALIGTSYAEAFPHSVRAMILDSTIDPAQDQLSLLIDQARGLQQAFDAFAVWCTTRSDCALGQDKSQAVKTFRDRVLPLIDDPVKASDGRTLSYNNAMAGVIQALYTPNLWPTLNQGLQELAQGHGDSLMRMADLYYERSADGTYSNAMDAFLAVRCVDNPPVTDRDVARNTDAQYRVVAPFLDTGRPPSPALDNCAFWPVPPTGGPHDPHITEMPPVLVISTTHDPIAPYQAGVNLTQDLNGRLLTLDGTQHTAFLQGIDCIDVAGITYLTTLQLPPEGTRC